MSLSRYLVAVKLFSKKGGSSACDDVVEEASGRDVIVEVAGSVFL